MSFRNVHFQHLFQSWSQKLLAPPPLQLPTLFSQLWPRVDIGRDEILLGVMSSNKGETEKAFVVPLTSTLLMTRFLNAGEMLATVVASIIVADYQPGEISETEIAILNSNGGLLKNFFSEQMVETFGGMADFVPVTSWTGDEVVELLKEIQQQVCLDYLPANYGQEPSKSTKRSILLIENLEWFLVKYPQAKANIEFFLEYGRRQGVFVIATTADVGQEQLLPFPQWICENDRYGWTACSYQNEQKFRPLSVDETDLYALLRRMHPWRERLGISLRRSWHRVTQHMRQMAQNWRWNWDIWTVSVKRWKVNDE